MLNWSLTENLRVCKKIGSGAYGLVYLVEDINTNKYYALKVISKLTNNKNYNSATNNKPSIELENKIHQLFEKTSNALLSAANSLNLNTIRQIGHNYHYFKEISTHLKVNNHPNVVTIHNVYSYQDYLFILMDYYPNGDLFTTIVDKKIFAENPAKIKLFFLQLLNVIKYCHQNSIYHCDIKPENILVNEDYSKLAITDFGLAVQTEYVSDSLCCGSSYYMAPERLINTGVPAASNNYYPTSAGDIWSLGIILINLTCIRNPWMKACRNDETFEVYMTKQDILYKILPISKELLFILTNYFLVKNPFMRSSDKLDVIKKLIINCKSFTKSGPLSKCDVFEEEEFQEQLLVSSSLSFSNKRGLEQEPLHTNSDDEYDFNNHRVPHKRLSINSNSSCSLSSLSLLYTSSDDNTSTVISTNDSSNSCTSCGSSSYCPKSVVQCKKPAASKIKFIKNSNEVSYVNIKSPIDKKGFNVMNINNLVDFEFTFDPAKQYSTSSLFNHSKK